MALWQGGSEKFAINIGGLIWDKLARATIRRQNAYREGSAMFKRRLVRWGLGASLVLLAALGAWLWFAPCGTGEYRHSPDGRFTAEVWNLTAGTLLYGHQSYIEVRVVDAGSGQEVWRVVCWHAPEAEVPDYGDRGQRFIRWAANSSSVTIPVDGGKQLVLAVP
jgi:hypothetical protein